MLVKYCKGLKEFLLAKDCKKKSKTERSTAVHVSTLMVCLPIDLEGKSTRQVEQILESQGVTEESSQLSSASSHGRRIRWLLSSASLGNIEEEADSVRVESSASGATLEVSIHIKYDKFILTFYSNIQIHVIFTMHLCC